MHPLSYLASLLAGLCGAMGFGSGTVLLLYLTAVLQLDPQTAQGINLLFFLPCAALALAVYCRDNALSFRPALRLLVWTLPGAAVGFLLLPLLPVAVLRRLFGGFLVLAAVREIIIVKYLLRKYKIAAR